MSERPKEIASKAIVVQATEGSNPSVTASRNGPDSLRNPGLSRCQGPVNPQALVQLATVHSRHHWRQWVRSRPELGGRRTQED